VEAAAPAHAFEIQAGAIVYSRLAPGAAGGLVIANSDGSGARAFHPAGAGLAAASAISAPAVSPDGSRVAFADQASGAIWVAGIDGTQPVRISNPPLPHATDSEPAWTPDGRTVYFTRRSDVEKGQIWSAWADGRGDSSLWSTTGTEDSSPAIAPDGSLAFVRVGGGQDGIYIWRFSGTPTFVAAASEPAWSPDGSRLVYIRQARLYIKGLNAGDPEQLLGTSGLTARDPAFAADGRIVFTGVAPGAQESRIWVVDPRDGALQQVDAGAGAGVQDNAPAWQTMRKTKVDRVGGADRIDTAVDASRLGYDTPGAGGVGQNGGRVAKAVVLSRSDTFADALAGSALAGHLGGPLLLTGTKSLDGRTAAEIRRVLPAGGTVYLLGDTGALSSAVASQAAGLGYTVKRLAGPDRFATATVIAEAITPTPDKILVATGMNFPDALAAGAAAASTPGAVVLLSDDRVLPTSTAQYLAAHVNVNTQLFGIGDQGAAALRTRYAANRVRSAAGADRFATAADVARTFFTGGDAPHVVGLATGYNWPDALAGGALVGANAGPLLLSDNAAIPGPEAEYARTEAGAIGEVVVNGDVGVVPPNAAATLANMVGASAFWDYFDNRGAPALP